MAFVFLPTDDLDIPFAKERDPRRAHKAAAVGRVGGHRAPLPKPKGSPPPPVKRWSVKLVGGA